MDTTPSFATRNTAMRGWSLISLLAVLAAVSACSVSGGAVEPRQPTPPSRVELKVDESGHSEPRHTRQGELRTGSGLGENESEPRENEGEPRENEGEPDEHEQDENEGGGNEA